MISFEERLERMKRLSLINEAKYSLVDGIDEDDSIPNDVYGEPKPQTANDSTIGEDDELEGEEVEGGAVAPEAEVGAQQAEPQEDAPEAPIDLAMGEIPPVEPKSQEDVQNDILKLNVAALEKIQVVMDDIEASVGSLNNKVEDLNADVEEVREPTNVEKLERRKEDSHPYYYNLNSMWDGNSFQARMDQTGDQGIIKLDDGTYMAKFDDLPQHNHQQIKDSFKNY